MHKNSLRLPRKNRKRNQLYDNRLSSNMSNVLYWLSLKFDLFFFMLIWNILFSGFTYNFGRTCKPFNPYLRHQGSNVQICIYPIRDHVENFHGFAEMCPGRSFGIQKRFYGSAATKIQRNPIFSTINSEDINYFRDVLGEKNVIQDEDRLSAANMDWMRKYRGSSKLLLQPRSSEEVTSCLFYKKCPLFFCACYFLRISVLYA